MNPRTYDFGKQGRISLNEKLARMMIGIAISTSSAPQLSLFFVFILQPISHSHSLQLWPGPLLRQGAVEQVVAQPPAGRVRTQVGV